jgi:septal ring factor EnvC (AmiA/AmiB activator)
MRNLALIVFALSMLVLWLLPTSAMAQANSAAEQAATEAQLKAIAEALKQREAAIGKRNRQLSLTEQELQQLERQISTVAAELNATERLMAASRTKLAELSQQQLLLEQQQQHQVALLAQQLDRAYRIGQHDFLKLILNQEEPTKLERMLGYYGYFNRARMAELQALQQIERELAAVLTQTAEQQQQLQQQLATQRRQQGVLQEQQREQKTLITRLQREQSADQQQLEKLRRDHEELEQVLAAIIAALRAEPRLVGLSQQKGRLNWPAQGRVQRLFGTQRSSGVTWKGVMIDAAAGTPITAIADGRVLFANWMRGFGLLLVVDHGDGYLTLYGHTQTVIPAVGATVRKGETIALVGQSGGQTAPGLYFEMRVNGNAVNPTQWIR